MINVPVPESGEGKRIYLAIEDDLTATEYGVEFLHLPIEQIRVVRKGAETMSRTKIFLTLLSTLLVVQVSTAQSGGQYGNVMANIADANYGTFDNNIPDDDVQALNHMRRERFRFILPRVMRERDIDMWIHIIRPWAWGGTDPLRYKFGSKSAASRQS